MFSKFVAWAREHPIWLGVGVFVVGIALLWLFGFFSRKQTAAAPNNAASYYAAETAANQAAAVQEAARQAAMVQIGGIDAQKDTAIATVNAAADVANTKSANDLTASLAQLDYLAHNSDNQVLETYSNNEAARAVAQVHAAADENIAISTAAYAYNTAVHLDQTNQILETIRATTLLASEAQVALGGRGGVYGISTPSTGQITIANSSIGGPVDPVLLAQVAQYPWLRGAAATGPDGVPSGGAGNGPLPA